MTFSVKTAHALALASRNIYLDESEAKNQASDLGFNAFRWIEAHDTQCCVMADDTRGIVAFRGTEPDNLRDWLTDADVFKIPVAFGPVYQTIGEAHHGFQEALNHVWLELEIAIVGVVGPKPLYVTGHSLGAALATLAVARWGAGRLYTFGSPRVFDDKAAAEFDKRHRSYRFMNNNDIVARIPLMGYKHVSSLRYFTHKGKMWAEPNKFWLTYDRLCGRVKRRIDGIRDHDMSDYASLVGKYDSP